MPAGRPRTAANRDLPPRLKRRRSGDGFLYYFVRHDGYQEPLGGDREVALERWKTLYGTSPQARPTSFTVVSEAFERSEHFAGLGLNTQRDYRNILKRLRIVFKHAAMETITGRDIRKMKKAMVAIKTQFNNARAVVSSLYRWAIDEEELFECDNPCAGVSLYAVKPRRVKVTSEMYYAVYDQAPEALKDWMDLDTIIGQRVSDVLKLTKNDIDSGKLHAAHGKTGGIVELPIEDDLDAVLRRIQGRDGKVKSIYLIADGNGQPLSYWQLRVMFDNAHAAAKKEMGRRRARVDQVAAQRPAHQKRH